VAFSLQAVFDRINVINATKSGMNTAMAVILKFYVKRENKYIPFGWVGVKVSLSGLLLLRELYPLTSRSDDSAAKHGFISVSVIKEKKLICTTAIIYTPIILPEIRPINKKADDTPDIAVDRLETISDIL
jgi:hypothetical protein